MRAEPRWTSTNESGEHRLQGYVFPAKGWPVWCDRNMWAPEIHHVNGRFLAYFSCAAPNGRHSVGVAVSQTDSHLGPYLDLGVPLVYHNEVEQFVLPN